MAVNILESGDKKHAAMYDDSSLWAFGPVFAAEGEWTAGDAARAFLHWLDRDPRLESDESLERLHWEWQISLAEKEAR